MLTLTKEPTTTLAVVFAAAADAAVQLGAAASSLLVALLLTCCLLLACWKQLFRYDLTGGQPTTGALQELTCSHRVSTCFESLFF